VKTPEYFGPTRPSSLGRFFEIFIYESLSSFKILKNRYSNRRYNRLILQKCEIFNTWLWLQTRLYDNEWCYVQFSLSYCKIVFSQGVAFPSLPLFILFARQRPGVGKHLQTTDSPIRWNAIPQTKRWLQSSVLSGASPYHILRNVQIISANFFLFKYVRKS
jgi:hypothetical protein